VGRHLRNSKSALVGTAGEQGFCSAARPFQVRGGGPEAGLPPHLLSGIAPCRVRVDVDPTSTGTESIPGRVDIKRPKWGKSVLFDTRAEAVAVLPASFRARGVRSFDQPAALGQPECSHPGAFRSLEEGIRSARKCPLCGPGFMEPSLRDRTGGWEGPLVAELSTIPPTPSWGQPISAGKVAAAMARGGEGLGVNYGRII